MAEHPLRRLDPSGPVLDRAQSEPFSFALLDGDVVVRNEGYEHPENHEYRVRIEDGLPVSCPCPADWKYPGPCKHRVAIAIRPRILDVVDEATRLTNAVRRPRE